VVSGQAQVSRVSRIPDARISGRVRAGDVLGPVVGGIVRDDQLEVAKCLDEERLSGLSEVSLTVADRKPDADTWVSGGKFAGMGRMHELCGCHAL